MMIKSLSVPFVYACVSFRRFVFGGSVRAKPLRAFVCLWALMCAPVSAWSNASKNSSGGMLAFNLYPYLSDVDTDSVFSLNMASSLPRRLSYFGFVNLYNQAEDAPLQDTVSFYSEWNLRWQVKEHAAFDATVQHVMRSDGNNDRTRFGVRWRLNDSAFFTPFFSKLNTKWSINLHAIQFDDNDATEWQLEHAYSMAFPYFTDRLYLAGFIDHTFNEELSSSFPSNPIVSETQMGYRLVENLYVVYEYRINQYRIDRETNHAIGMEYKIRW